MFLDVSAGKGYMTTCSEEALYKVTDC